MSNLIEFLKTILPWIGGAVSGLWLSPLISRRSRKKSLKAELIQEIIVFLNYKGAYFLSQNYVDIQNAKCAHISTRLRSPDLSDIVRAEELRTHAVYKENVDKNIRNMEDIFQKLVQAEGKLYYLREEVETVYGKKIRRKIDSDIERALQLNTASLYRYIEMSESELNQAFLELNTGISERLREMAMIRRDLASKLGQALR